MNTKSFEEIISETGSLLYETVGDSMLPLVHESRDYVYITKRQVARQKKHIH